MIRGCGASGHYQMSPEQQSQQCVLLQGTANTPRDCHSQEVAVLKHGSFTRPLPWLCLGVSHCPSQGGLCFRGLHLLHLQPHRFVVRGWIAAEVGNGLVFQAQSCCCLLQTPFQGTDQITLLSPLKQYRIWLNSLRKQIIPVNSLKSSSYHSIIIPPKGTDTTNTLGGKPWKWAHFKLKQTLESSAELGSELLMHLREQPSMEQEM